MSARPDCPHCEGAGMVRAGDPDGHPPKFKRCECVLREDILSNAERVMPGLAAAAPVARSPLADKWNQSVMIHAPERWFRSHLRHVAIRRPPIWAGRVVSDADLITAWLASVALNGKDVLDPDAYAMSTEYITLLDLAHPPDLLVIRMGVKAARNVAAPEVLAETIMLRKHAQKPTWIWAVPDLPLAPGHLFWSDEVGRSMSDFIRIGAANDAALASPVPTDAAPVVSSKPISKKRALR